MARLTSSSVHASSSVSNAVVEGDGANGGGRLSSMSVRIVLTLLMKNWMNWSVGSVCWGC